MLVTSKMKSVIRRCPPSCRCTKLLLYLTHLKWLLPLVEFPVCRTWWCMGLCRAFINILIGVYSRRRLVFPVPSVMSLHNTSRAKEKSCIYQKLWREWMAWGNQAGWRLRRENQARATATLQCAKTKMGKWKKAGTNRARSSGWEISRVLGKIHKKRCANSNCALYL